MALSFLSARANFNCDVIITAVSHFAQSLALPVPPLLLPARVSHADLYKKRTGNRPPARVPAQDPRGWTRAAKKPYLWKRSLMRHALCIMRYVVGSTTCGMCDSFNTECGDFFVLFLLSLPQNNQIINQPSSQPAKPPNNQPQVQDSRVQVTI